MKSIKDKKRDLDMQAKYDLISAVKVSQNGQTSYMGVKPKRTYSGPRYLGGISDHLPVVFKLYKGE